ncbi:MAG: DUF58 domain-containing protein, partial [Flavobacteriales bacterium]
MKLIRSIFLTRRAFIAGWIIVGLFLFGWIWAPLLIFAKLSFLIILISLFAELFILFGKRSGMEAQRHTYERWSNGDQNPVSIALKSGYGMAMHVRVLDELPVQFQKRDLVFIGKIAAWGSRTFEYTVRPVQRGVYHYGAVQA